MIEKRFILLLLAIAVIITIAALLVLNLYFQRMKRDPYNDKRKSVVYDIALLGKSINENTNEYPFSLEESAGNILLLNKQKKVLKEYKVRDFSDIVIFNSTKEDCKKVNSEGIMTDRTLIICYDRNNYNFMTVLRNRDGNKGLIWAGEWIGI